MFYYTYRIDFEDGFYYIGSRKSKLPPDRDTRYNGSPVTHKEKWIDGTPFTKTVTGVYENSDMMYKAEELLIGELFLTDPLCLNRHNKTRFNTEGLKWFTNGEIFVRATECPDGFWNGARSTPHTEETKSRMREWNLNNSPVRGYKHTDETKAVISAKSTGRVHSEETKKKISDATKGRLVSEKTRALISVSNKGVLVGDRNPMSRQDVKERHSRVVSSEEYRKRLSDAVKRSDRWTEEKRKEQSERVRKQLLTKPPSAKKVLLNGVEYKSIVDAMKHTGLSRPKVKKLAGL